MFTIELEAPEEEKTFLTDWRMVREAVHWFGEIVSEIVEVTCPPAPGPPALRLPIPCYTADPANSRRC